MIPVGSKEHYEKLLYDYKDILNEQGSYRHGSNLDNSIDITYVTALQNYIAEQ